MSRIRGRASRRETHINLNHFEPPGPKQSGPLKQLSEQLVKQYYKQFCSCSFFSQKYNSGFTSQLFVFELNYSK